MDLAVAVVQSSVGVGFDVFPQGAGVSVTLGAAWALTCVRFSVQVCPLVFGSVTGVAEGFDAAAVLTNIRLLSRVAAQVDLQVLQTRERFRAAFEHALVGLLPAVHPHVDQEFVAGIERFVSPNAARPETRELLPLPLVDVHLLDVPHQLLLASVGGTTVQPVTQMLQYIFQSARSTQNG